MKRRIIQDLALMAVLLCAPFAAAETPPVMRTLELAPADGPAISARGLVVTPDGQPVAGAHVALRAQISGRQYTSGLKHNRDVLARTKTDSAGRFDLDKVLIPARFDEVTTNLVADRGGAQLLAWADGWGLTWADLRGLSSDTLKLTLRPEAKIEGVVSNEAGKGLPGARIDVYGITPAMVQYDAFLSGSGDLNLSLSELDFGAVGDSEGRFTMRHLPAGYRVSVNFQSAAHARKHVMIDTQPGSFTEMRSVNAGREAVAVVRSPISLELARQRWLTVRVSEHDGRSVSGGAIEMITEERRFGGWETVKEDGSAQLAASKAGKFRFRYASDPLEPALGVMVTREIPDAEDLPPVEIRLPPSRWLAGHVRDAQTRAGVPGAYVAFTAADGSKPDASRVSSLAMSGQDGSFRLPVVPGPGQLRFQHPVYGYFVPNYMHRGERPSHPVEISETGPIQPVELALSRGLVLQGFLRDGQGAAVAGATVRAENIEQPHARAATQTDTQGWFRLTGLSPHIVTHLSVAHEQGGARRIIVADAMHAWDRDRVVDLELTLEPGVALTGRVLKQGQPQAGVLMRLYRNRLGEANSYNVYAEETTDAEGRYTVSGLAPGDRYWFEIVTADGSSAPDWKHQSPYVASVPPGAAGLLQMPNVNLIKRDQVLAGVVQDPQGRPVPGIRVSASMLDRSPLVSDRNSPSYVDTDAQGRFEIRNLPDREIELMAYRPNLAGGSIRYPSRVRPKLNQRDIRILLDPALLQPIEDLDAKPLN